MTVDNYEYLKRCMTNSEKATSYTPILARDPGGTRPAPMKATAKTRFFAKTRFLKSSSAKQRPKCHPEAHDRRMTHMSDAEPEAPLSILSLSQSSDQAGRPDDEGLKR